MHTEYPFKVISGLQGTFQKKAKVFFSLFLEVRDVRPFLILLQKLPLHTHKHNTNTHTHTHAHTEKFETHRHTHAYTYQHSYRYTAHTDILLHIQYQQSTIELSFFQEAETHHTRQPNHRTTMAPHPQFPGVPHLGFEQISKLNYKEQSVSTECMYCTSTKHKTHTFIESNDCHQMMLPRCASVCNSWE